MRQRRVWKKPADQPMLLALWRALLGALGLFVCTCFPAGAAQSTSAADAQLPAISSKPVATNGSSPGTETKPLIMRIATLRELSPNHEIVDLLRAAYARLGYRMELVQLPAARSVREVADGFLDGELARAESPALQQAGLIRVPAPVAEISASAFVHDANLPISDYASLLPYQIDTLFGLPLLEQRLAKHRLEKVGTMEQALRRVATGRTQVAVLPTKEGRDVLAKLALSGVSVIEPPLEVVPLHHYLNVRHRALAEPLAEAISELRRAGRQTAH